MSTTLTALAERWRQDAELLDRYGDSRGAAACRLHADQLDAALREAGDEALTLTEAAGESGYSVERLRHMVADGVVPNAGRKGSPRIRRADLPRKQRSRGNGFDPAAAAERVLARRSN